MEQNTHPLMNPEIERIPAGSEAGPLRIAVTGGAGSGKSIVCERLQSLGLKVFSADELAREAVRPGRPAYDKIVAYFGPKVLAGDKTLDRRLLRHIIVNDGEARKALERFVHPEIIRLMYTRLADGKDAARAVVMEVPLLFELGLETHFDVVLLVAAARPIRTRRLMQRDRVSGPDAEALLDSQMADADKMEKADVVIRNEGTIEQIYRAVDSFYATFCKKRSKMTKALDSEIIM